ncbi:MAG: hypothetical protein M1375_00340 [Candidatus Thermoplasmatota archaeon]|jgi:rRNA processing protein Gar1|nr:hypothetical protein [Candidatus Thermoplasmatota archaeon]MCL5790410.1 hypothetical protein [Candidatus Thermoplasmatota archaeon]
MFKPIPVIHTINHEFVVKEVTEDMMNKPVFDQTGKKVGKIIRIMGPVNDPYGLVSITDQVPVGGEKFFVKV